MLNRGEPREPGDPCQGDGRETTVMVHGVLVQVSGYGVLITGESGIGKTSLGLEIAALGHRWVADDAVVLEERGRLLFGRGHERTKKLVATRDKGILEVETLLGPKAVIGETRVDVIVHLTGDARKHVDTVGDGCPSVREIVGVPLPCYRFTVGNNPREIAGKVLGKVQRSVSQGMV